MNLQRFKAIRGNKKRTISTFDRIAVNQGLGAQFWRVKEELVEAKLY